MVKENTTKRIHDLVREYDAGKVTQEEYDREMSELWAKRLEEIDIEIENLRRANNQRIDRIRGEIKEIEKKVHPHHGYKNTVTSCVVRALMNKDLTDMRAVTIVLKHNFPDKEDITIDRAIKRVIRETKKGKHHLFKKYEWDKEKFLLKLK
jgi:SMC interacting uncharacterized protein involved in chromosome segregation